MKLLGKASLRPTEVKNCTECLQTRWSSYDKEYMKLQCALTESDCNDEELEKVHIEYYELRANYQQKLYTLTDRDTTDRVSMKHCVHHQQNLKCKLFNFLPSRETLGQLWHIERT